MSTQHRILALIYDEFEALDFWGPLGAILPRCEYYTLKVVNVHEQSGSNGAVESTIKNGIGIVPNISWADALAEEEQFSTLFIPGGVGNRPLLNDHVLLQQIGQLVDRAASIFTVCTGSVILAATGRLEGHKATTNKLAYDALTPNCTLQLLSFSYPTLTIFPPYRSRRPLAKARSLGARWQIFDLVGHHGRYRCGSCFHLQYICCPREP